MLTEVDIPSDLTDSDKAIIFQILDEALLHGMYTGILAITLWNISSKLKKWEKHLECIFIALWFSPIIHLDPGYGSLHEYHSHRLIYVSKAIEIYHYYSNAPDGVFPTLYISFLLATTLWCTILIIYHILAVTRAKHGASSGLRVYCHFIEVLIESSALYSISLIVYLAFAICGDIGMMYLDPIAGITKGITLTLLIGQAAAGHTCPNDNYNENTVSSLHFQAPSEVGTTTFQESTIESTILETDIEAQHQQSNELMKVVERHNNVQDK
ncbi:hypothetical protein ARMGADRAFT_1144199 [Armillaria gallica]|uniref:Uncharacterized protein n=1 Tax=Armillaria gallica TaxID=47427 RepID=A0A2H3CZH8_ARMGA|nr:hypothetical protein ARMGADRAFT_1144199 [Armillaria gallica]